MKFITRRDAQGNVTYHQVAADYALQNGEQFVEIHGLQLQSNGDALTRARTEERGRLNGRIEQERQERIQLQTQFDAIKTELETLKREREERERAGLKPDERRDREFKELQASLNAQLQQANQQIQNMAAQQRATELFAYRERALRSVGNGVIPEMVGGNTEAEIDASIDAAVAMYNNMNQRFMQMYGVDPNRPVHVPPQLPAGPVPTVQQFDQYGRPVQPAPIAVTPPQSPYYVPPSGGFPTAPATGQTFDPGAGPDLGQLTSEEAVRSGRYGGELRAEILRRVQQGQGGAPLPIGVTPRYLAAPPGYNPGAGPGVRMPDGSMAPPSNPSPAVPYAPGWQPPPASVQAPQYAPQYAPAPPQGGQDARSLAHAAFERTRAGMNPVVGQMSPQDQSAVRTSVQQVQGVQGDPSAIFNSRFQHTPPLQQAPGAPTN